MIQSSQNRKPGPKLAAPAGYVSVHTAADMLNVSKQTIRRWCDEKNPKATRLESIRDPENAYRFVAIHALQALKRRRNAEAAEVSSRDNASSVPELALHYLPQVIVELQSIAGQAIAEFIANPMSQEVLTLRARFDVLFERASILITDVARDGTHIDECTALKTQLNLAGKRVAELVFVDRGDG